MILIRCSVCGKEDKMSYAGTILTPGNPDRTQLQLHSLPDGWYDAGNTGNGPVCSKDCLRIETRREIDEREYFDLNLREDESHEDPEPEEESRTR